MRRRIVTVCAWAWLVIFAGSFFWVRLITPTGDGFTRGMNRITALMGWQALAGVLAIICLAGYLGFPRPRPKWLRLAGWGPMIGTGLLIGFVVGLFVYSAAVKPPPSLG